MRRLLAGGILAVALSSPLSAQELMDRIVINGYTNFEFSKQLSKEGPGDKNGSFDADQFDLVFNITVSERVRAALDLSWEHGTATEDGRGNQAMEYGFVEYAVSDMLKLRFGKMSTPFGVFNEIERPRLPVATDFTNTPNCTNSERSRPNSRLIRSTSASSARSPRMALVGSPGSSRTSTKTTIRIKINVGISCSNRRRRKDANGTGRTSDGISVAAKGQRSRPFATGYFAIQASRNTLLPSGI